MARRRCPYVSGSSKAALYLVGCEESRTLPEAYEVCARQSGAMSRYRIDGQRFEAFWRIEHCSCSATAYAARVVGPLPALADSFDDDRPIAPLPIPAFHPWSTVYPLTCPHCEKINQTRTPWNADCDSCGATISNSGRAISAGGGA